jgi:hypothetical protein
MLPTHSLQELSIISDAVIYGYGLRSENIGQPSEYLVNKITDILLKNHYGAGFTIPDFRATAFEITKLLPSSNKQDIRVSILGFDSPYPLTDVLKHLQWATQYLLNEKNYDGHNYEELNQCVSRAHELIENINKYCIEINNVKPSSPSGENGVPIWYTESEMYDWLLLHNYSREIAKELSGLWAKDLQRSFEKGWEKAMRDDGVNESNSKLILDLSDEQQYFVRLKNGNKVFKSGKFNQESKFECLYWIYMNSNCFLSTGF